MSEFWSTAEERVVTHKSSFFEIENTLSLSSTILHDVWNYRQVLYFL